MQTNIMKYLGEWFPSVFMVVDITISQDLMETVVSIIMFRVSWRKEGVLWLQCWTWKVYRLMQMKNMPMLKLRKKEIFAHGTFCSV